jgi:hypothetical protein
LFEYSGSGDNLWLFIEGGSDGTTTQVIDTEMDSPAPDMILGTVFMNMSHTCYPGWNMIALPLEPQITTPKAVFTDDIEGKLWMYEWDGDAWKYRLLDISGDNMNMGKGYWLWVYGTTTVDVKGVQVDPSKGFVIKLNKGWNMIGCPFNFTPDWSKTEIRYGTETKNLPDASRAGWIWMNSLYEFDPIAWKYKPVSWIRPWYGCWFAAKVECEMIVSSNKMVTGGDRVPLLRDTGNKWMVNLYVTDGTYMDTAGFGVADNAKKGVDWLDRLRPPEIVESKSISIYFSHPEEELFNRLVCDLQPHEEELVWQFEIKSKIEVDSIAISWDSLPEGYALKLVDVDTGVEVDMHGNSEYTYVPVLEDAQHTSIRHFKIIGTQVRTSACSESGAIHAYPNPGSNRITFTGFRTTPATIRIYNIAGELVREEVVNSSSWEWDMKNNEGEMIANGVYFYMVTTSNGDKDVGKIGVVR